MPITGTVAVSGIIAPTSVLDTYPVTDPQWGLGGLRSVGTTTDRNNIEYPRRQEGMMVYVQDQDSYYALVGGTSNTDWILFNQSQSGQSQSGFFSSDAEINYPVGGFSASGFTGDRLLLATGPANDPFRNYIRYKEQWFQTGVAGVASQSITGDTISAGYGIGIVRGGNSVTVNNTGVTGFNGLSGNVSMTGSGALFGFGNNAIGVRNASASVTGVASFDPRYFTVATTGHVGLLGAYQVTGQTVVSGGSSQLVTSSGNTVTIDNRVASLTVTGVASFDPRYFTVGTTGHVGLTATFFSAESEQNYPVGGFSASGFTGDRLLLATGPANNPFRSYIRYENQWFQTGVVGVASQSITGDTISAGYGIGIIRDGNSVTVNNMGVTGFNGLSGNVSMTGAGALFGYDNNKIGVRNASSSLTGVASFDPRYFTIGTTGHVGLTATFFSAESEQNYPVGGFSASGFTGDRLLLATGPANDPFRSYIRYENQWFQTGVAGVGSPGATGANGTQILLIDSFSTSIDDILMKANTPYSLSGKTINVSYAGGVVPATGGIYLVNPSQGTGFPVGFPTSAMNTLTFSSQTLTAGVGETITLRLVVTGSSSGDAYDFSVGMGNTIRWGGSTHASLTGSQLGTALANELLVVNKSSGLPHSIDINIGYNQYIFYALPTRLGAVKQSINNAAYGGSYLQGDLDLPGDASVTHANTAGFSESFYVYRSKNPNLGMVEVRTVAST